MRLIRDIFTQPLPPERWVYEDNGAVIKRQWKNSGCLLAIVLVLFIALLFGAGVAFLTTR